MKDTKEQRLIGRSVRTFLWVLVAILIYAYGVQATEIDLDEPLEPQRQANLIGLLRQLARPDLFAYDIQTRSTNISIRMPCPEEIRGSQVTLEGRVVTLAPNCASTTQDVLTLSGEGFPANVEGVIGWHPAGSTAVRRLTTFKADESGRFSANFTLPDIRETEETQRIEVAEVLERNMTGLSETTQIALERIVETVLMALMASTIGTILAVPISFMAARNLMADVTSPLAALMAALVALPIGGAAGWWIVTQFVTLSARLSEEPIFAMRALLLTAVLIWLALRLGRFGVAEEDAPRRSPLVTWAAAAALVILFFLALALLAHLGLVWGSWLQARLGAFAFLGNFIHVVSDFTRLLLPTLAGVIIGLAAASWGSRYGQEAVLRLPVAPAKVLTAVLAALGTFVLIYAINHFINWICLFGVCNLLPQEGMAYWRALAWPAVMGGVAVALLSLLVAPKRPIPFGLVVYNLTRSVLNVTRAIEPVVLGFVFVTWVGIGPFAGVIALTLHSIADLGKLFSEQVEDIAEGPREAIKATGANQIQTIVYSVVPQVVPHYIAFIFYRWDINVRLSTIIGFVGGGGIGLVLQRFTNLTQYSQASVLIISIAIIVALLDYVSSRIRTRVI
jgi:phosphonate ABC transporter permease subunit PhnE